ncbi:hypothetical protein [Kingella sp. (in: b-proteobacteria)]|nr:hypothetical protein [Kingella sp. (in: b-proteobacteria)]MDO4658676.1 hypothetical protein [Kingella sp. (in: b-proteobacteria)]
MSGINARPTDKATPIRQPENLIARINHHAYNPPLIRFRQPESRAA